MDAAADVPEDRHTIVLAAEKTVDGVAVTVRDREDRHPYLDDDPEGA